MPSKLAAGTGIRERCDGDAGDLVLAARDFPQIDIVHDLLRFRETDGAARAVDLGLAHGLVEVGFVLDFALHGFKADGPAPSNGPRLNGIVGRAKGATGFGGYSAAMKERAAKGEKWDEAAIDAFVANPKAYLPGTTMGFAGLGNPDRRADLVAFLMTLK